MRRILFLLIPVLLVAAACGASSGNAAAGHDDHGGNSPVADDARTITITASSFEFDPPSLSAEVGESLAIELKAADIEHDFVIDELDAHLVAGAGETATGGFSASTAGSYTFYCSVPGHRQAGMEGVLIVS